MGPAVILIGIGASLPAPDGTMPRETCRAAAAALDLLPGLRLRALSRWWESAPIPPMPGPPRPAKLPQPGWPSGPP